MGLTIDSDPLDYDPFEGDELLSEAEHDRPEPSDAMKIAIMALARASMDADVVQRQASTERPPPHVLEPSGPRQRKRRQRRLLFEALRRGLSPAVACERAGVTAETFAAWCERPVFAEAVERAGLWEIDEWTPTLDVGEFRDVSPRST